MQQADDAFLCQAKPAGCCEPAVPWNLVLECGSRPSHDGDAVVPRFIQFSARTSGVNECTVGGRTQPATNDPGRLRAHLSCKRAALSAHKRDLSLPRRGGERGLGCGGVGQPNTLPPRPAAGSKALLEELGRMEGWKDGSLPSLVACLAPTMRFFHFYIKKKQNFKNICRIRKFSKMGACRPLMGDRVHVAHPVGDRT